MGEIRRVRGNQIPHGTILGWLVAAEGQCGKTDCDSWKTVGIDVDITGDDGDATVRYVVCLKHLAEFVDETFLKGGGILESSEDCGDPDCPVHGYLREDEDAEDE